MLVDWTCGLKYRISFFLDPPNRSCIFLGCVPCCGRQRSPHVYPRHEVGSHVPSVEKHFSIQQHHKSWNAIVISQQAPRRSEVEAITLKPESRRLRETLSANEQRMGYDGSLMDFRRGEGSRRVIANYYLFHWRQRVRT